MINIRKILNIILIILLVTTVIEIGYLFIPKTGINWNKLLKPSTGESVKTAGLPANSVCPTPTPLFSPNDSRLLLLTQLKNDFQGNLVSSTLSNKFQGKIISITNAQPGKSYKVKIVLIGKDNNHLPFFFNDNDLRLASVSEVLNGKTQSINLNSLKIGDQITLEATIDLTKNMDNNTVGIKIIKL